MTDNYWPEDWNLRDKMGWRLRMYYVRARRAVRLRRGIFGVEFWVMAGTFAAGVVIFFLPEIIGWLGY
jgi:hypothetical protein